jgi:erythronate-4-phosphate dehydrogenase
VKVVCDEAIADALAAFGGEGIDQLCLLSARHIDAESIRGADAVIVRSTVQVDERLFAHHTPRYVGTATIGCDHIDLDLLSERGCHFLSAQGSSAASVAQFTWAMIMHLTQIQKRPLASYRMGVVGCGAIGERVARCGEHLGLDVLRVDPWLNEENPNGPHVDALQDCDLISLHVPLIHDGPHATAEMITETWLKALPSGATIINTARGGLIHRPALLDALRGKNLASVALDVFPAEPAVDVALLSACSLATPHIAGRSMEGMAANTKVVADEFRTHFGLPKYEAASDSLSAPLIQVSPATDIEDFLAEIWNLPAIDQQMKESVRGSEEERAVAFRQMRKPPYRRDLTSYSIGGEMSPELEQFLNALQTTTTKIDSERQS